MKPVKNRFFFYTLAIPAFVAMVVNFSIASNLGWTPIDVEWRRTDSSSTLWPFPPSSQWSSTSLLLPILAGLQSTLNGAAPILLLHSGHSRLRRNGRQLLYCFQSW